MLLFLLDTNLLSSRLLKTVLLKLMYRSPTQNAYTEPTATTRPLHTVMSTLPIKTLRTGRKGNHRHKGRRHRSAPRRGTNHNKTTRRKAGRRHGTTLYTAHPTKRKGNNKSRLSRKTNHRTNRRIHLSTRNIRRGPEGRMRGAGLNRNSSRHRHRIQSVYNEAPRHQKRLNRLSISRLIPLIVILSPTIAINPTRGTATNTPRRIKTRTSSRRTSRLRNVTNRSGRIRGSSITVAHSRRSRLNPRRSTNGRRSTGLRRSRTHRLHNQNHARKGSHLHRLMSLQKRHPRLRKHRISRRITKHLGNRRIAGSRQ